jgi:hypothetical protein
MRLATGLTWMKVTALAGALAAGVSLGGCGDGAAPTPAGGGPANGLAVMASDFASTSISLVAADGTLAKDDCIDSGTAASGKLSQALSGDVTLPSQPQRGGGLWIIDSGNAAVTLLDPTTCAVRNQFSVATGFASNPHDVAVVSDKKVYVTRYKKNAAPADANSTGDDILILDRDSGAVTGRIDLSAQAAPVAGAVIQARPDRMVLADGKVYVTLSSRDAMLSTAGEGRVVIVDPATDAVTGSVSLTGLKGCSAMFLVAATKTLFVACSGPFADADQAAASGVAELDLSVSPPALAHITKAAAFGHPLTFFWVAALSTTRVFTSTAGTFPDAKNNVVGSNDMAFSFDPTSDTPVALGLETGPFDMGRGAIGDTLLFVPDATASKPRIHVFDISGAGAPTETTSFDPEPAKGLPPRELAWY